MPDVRGLVAAAGLPEHEAFRLLAVVLDVSLGEARGVRDVTDETARRFLELAEARREATPLQYLEGSAPFGPIDLHVDQRVLIPRPETEQMWEYVVSHLSGTEIVVDVGTGSGALALALKHVHPNLSVVATDTSADALDVARDNAARLGLDVEFRHGRLLEPLGSDLTGHVDVIVSNPPYVSDDEWGRLPEDVRREPRSALVAPDGGFAIIGELLSSAGEVLASDGWMMVEMGERHAGRVRRETPPDLVSDIMADLAGRDRFVIVRRAKGGRRDMVAAAVEAIGRGDVIGMPTDTVYGLAADPHNPTSVTKLFQIKGRDADKAVPLLVASIDQARTVAHVPDAAADLLTKHWPGGLTAVLPLAAGLAPGVYDAAAQTVAVRMPDHPVALQILRHCGPLAVTSANPSGSDPALDAAGAGALFGTSVAVLVDGRVGAGTASTVVDLTSSPPRVLRHGPIEIEEHDDLPRDSSH